MARPNSTAATAAGDVRQRRAVQRHGAGHRHARGEAARPRSRSRSARRPPTATGGTVRRAGKSKQVPFPDRSAEEQWHPRRGKAGSKHGHSHDGDHRARRRGTNTATTPATGIDVDDVARRPPPRRPHASAHAARRTPRRDMRPPLPRTRPASPPPPSGPLVAGLLISDVTPLPPGASPLVHTAPARPATAPPARQAIRATLLPALGGGLAVLLLLGLGAGRELRGRRRWRALPLGS